MVSPVKFSNHLIAGEVRIEVKPHQSVELRSPKFELRSMTQSVAARHEAATPRSAVAVHDVLTRVESGYAKLTRNPHSQESETIALWEKLRQQLPSSQSVLEGGLAVVSAIATRGRKPGLLSDLLSEVTKKKTSSAKKRQLSGELAKNKEAIAAAEQKLKDTKQELEVRKVQLRVYEAKPNEFANELTQFKNWVAQLEAQHSSQEKALQSLHKKRSKLENEQAALSSARSTKKK